MATAIATKLAERKLKSEMKNVTEQMAPEGEGPRTRGGGSGRGGGSDRGLCAKCCSFICQGSIWTRLICWAMIALVITSLVLWIGGAFLVGPAKTTTSTNVCGINLTVPLLRKDIYVFYLGTSGTIVLIMLLSSCVCCCSYFALCSQEAPSFKVVKVCGILGCVISLLATSVFIGWVALGTYFVINIHGAATICRNTIMYLALLYVYLLVVGITGCVVVMSRCNDWRTNLRTRSSGRMRQSTHRSRGSKYEMIPGSDTES